MDILYSKLLNVRIDTEMQNAPRRKATRGISLNKFMNYLVAGATVVV